MPPKHSTTRSLRLLVTARRTARTPGAGQDRGAGPATTLRAPLGPQRGAPHTPKHPKIPQNTPKLPGPPLLPQEAAKRESRGLGPGRGPLRERRGRPEGGAGPGGEGGAGTHRPRTRRRSWLPLGPAAPRLTAPPGNKSAPGPRPADQWQRSSRPPCPTAPLAGQSEEGEGGV